LNKKYRDVNVLSEICEKYPALEPGKITLFSPIYYPIAMVEMDMIEETYENFDPINEIILKMKSLGIVGISNISVATGLSEGYIAKIQNVLISDGLLDSNGLITEQGEKSVSEKKKITRKKNTKVFQIDSINRTVIAVDKKLMNSYLDEKTDIPMNCACIIPRDGIDTDTIERSLISEDYEAIVGKKRDVLRTNLVSVEDARFVEMRYARCYLLKYGLYEPMIFGKAFNRNEIGSYIWKPLFVLTRAQIDQFGFDSSIPLSGQMAYDSIYESYIAIDERRKDLRDRTKYAKKVLTAREKGKKEPEYFDDTVKTNLEKTANLKAGSFELNFDDLRTMYIAEVSLDSFTGINSFINFLISAAKSGEQVIAATAFQGYVVSLKTKDEEIQELIYLIKKELDNQDKQAFSKRLKGIFKRKPLNEETVAQMTLFVRDGIVPEKPEESDDE